jgi:hypothetical protein
LKAPVDWSIFEIIHDWWWYVSVHRHMIMRLLEQTSSTRHPPWTIVCLAGFDNVEQGGHSHRVHMWI